MYMQEAKFICCSKSLVEKYQRKGLLRDCFRKFILQFSGGGEGASLKGFHSVYFFDYNYIMKITFVRTRTLRPALSAVTIASTSGATSSTAATA